MNTQTFIDVADLPRSEGGYSQLYRDYINDFQNIQRFFEFDFRTLHSHEKFADHLNKRCTHRQILAEVLLKQNQEIGVSQSTLDNIRLLGEQNTFAVVTGQQVGIMSGPLYTIYKTITALKLVRDLNTIYPGYRFVPIFWLEGEDHDFEEVNKVQILNSENIPCAVEYNSAGKNQGRNYGPVGEIVFDDQLESFLNDLQNTLVRSEFTSHLFQTVRSCYKPGTTFNHAFASFLNSLFIDDGLIFISSNNRELKQLLSPIFTKEILEFPRISQLIIEQSAALEEQYHAQIKTKALNLFYFYKEGRYFIEPRENDFSLKGTRHFISKEEMLRIAAENPELLSPNVALRPLCQDTLLPTFAYVAGPSEVAYFAQLRKVYQALHYMMPIIYPRAGATMVEEKFDRIFDKYGLELSDIFGNQDKLHAKVIDVVSEVNIDEMFREAYKKVHDLTSEMNFGLNYIDPTLLGALGNSREKIEQQLSVLREKVKAAGSRKHEIAIRQIAKVSHTIYPKNNFQERELSIIHFMNKHGFDFVDSLKKELVIDQFKHQIIRI